MKGNFICTFEGGNQVQLIAEDDLDIRQSMSREHRWEFSNAFFEGRVTDLPRRRFVLQSNGNRWTELVPVYWPRTVAASQKFIDMLREDSLVGVLWQPIEVADDEQRFILSFPMVAGYEEIGSDQRRVVLPQGADFALLPPYFCVVASDRAVSCIKKRKLKIIVDIDNDVEEKAWALSVAAKLAKQSRPPS